MKKVWDKPEVTELDFMETKCDDRKYDRKNQHNRGNWWNPCFPPSWPIDCGSNNGSGSVGGDTNENFSS